MVADKDNQGQDAHLEAVQNFTLTSFKLKPQDWREFLSKEDNQILLNSFFNAEDNCNMFLCQDSEGSLSVSLNLPPNTQSKLICVSKTGSKVNTAEGASKILNFQEVAREDALSIVLAFCDEGICPFLHNPESSRGWEEGMAEEVLGLMGSQKEEALLMREQIREQTFPPPPDANSDHTEDMKPDEKTEDKDVS